MSERWPQYNVSHNPDTGSGDLYEWEVFEDHEHEDFFLAGCPSLETAHRITDALRLWDQKPPPLQSPEEAK